MRHYYRITNVIAIGPTAQERTKTNTANAVSPRANGQLLSTADTSTTSRTGQHDVTTRTVTRALVMEVLELTDWDSTDPADFRVIW